MNKVILLGRLTRDPEIRYTQAAEPMCVAKYGIAVNRRFKKEGGQEADFINCVSWRKQAENIAKYCNKGSQVAVEGRIQTRSYDHQDGTKRYVTEVLADNVTFLGSKGSNTNTSFSNESEFNNVDNSDIETTDITEDPFKDFGSEVELSDDDLPF